MNKFALVALMMLVGNSVQFFGLLEGLFGGLGGHQRTQSRQTNKIQQDQNRGERREEGRGQGGQVQGSQSGVQVTQGFSGQGGNLVFDQNGVLIGQGGQKGVQLNGQGGNLVFDQNGVLIGQGGKGVQYNGQGNLAFDQNGVLIGQGGQGQFQIQGQGSNLQFDSQGVLQVQGSKGQIVQNGQSSSITIELRNQVQQLRKEREDIQTEIIGVRKAIIDLISLDSDIKNFDEYSLLELVGMLKVQIQKFKSPRVSGTQYYTEIVNSGKQLATMQQDLIALRKLIDKNGKTQYTDEINRRFVNANDGIKRLVGRLGDLETQYSAGQSGSGKRDIVVDIIADNSVGATRN